MKTSRTKFMLTLAAALVLTATVYAKDEVEFKEAGEYVAKGGAKELRIEKDVRYCRIDTVDGSVIINTIVIREGGKKTPVKVTARINKGEKHTVDFGKVYSITGLRISDGAGGKYKVMLGK